MMIPYKYFHQGTRASTATALFLRWSEDASVSCKHRPYSMTSIALWSEDASMHAYVAI